MVHTKGLMSQLNGDDENSGQAELPFGFNPVVYDAVSAARQRLALAEQSRREAVYEARSATGERPSALPPVHRDKLPTLDDVESGVLVEAGREHLKKRLSTVAVVVGTVAGTAGAAALEQLIEWLVKRH